MKPKQPTRVILSTGIVVLACLAMGQEEDSEDGGTQPEISVDTLGKL